MKFEDGILAITRKMTGKMLLLEEANSMLEFYDDNELSRQKIKKVASVLAPIYTNKSSSCYAIWKNYITHLNLDTVTWKLGSLNLHVYYQSDVTIGLAGTQNVSVCTIHQNTVLIYTASYLNIACHDLIAKVVWDPQNKECMVHHCAKCPGKN